jgi:predicted anti-sigma-YlaC factor YlaD
LSVELEASSGHEMSSENICQREHIVAYLDGELDGSTLTDFEHHVEECEACRTELRRERQFFCELDAAIADEQNVSTPVDFARIVAAYAVTDMRGVRSRTEHKRALRLIAVLALAAFALLGASASTVIIGGGQVIVRGLIGLGGFLGEAIYDAGASAVVISRVLSRKFFIESGSLGLLVVFLVLAVLLLSRLIASYHRARTIE